jgi:hypothetical protein
MTEKPVENHPQMQPASPAEAPDTARTYERAKPEKEAGMGRLDNNEAIPEDCPDKIEAAVTNKQPNRQLNAHDVIDGRDSRPADGAKVK